LVILVLVDPYTSAIEPELAAKVLEASADTVMLVAPSGHMTVVSTSLTEVLGRPAYYWEGRHVQEMLHPTDVEIFCKLLEQHPTEPGARRRDVVRVRVLSERGAWLMIEARGFTRIEHDSIVGAVVSFRDIRGLVGLSTATFLADATLLPGDAGRSTAIDNRKHIAEQVIPAVMRSCATARQFCVLGIRMTNFEAVAAAHGTTRADEAILGAARAVIEVVRPTDLVSRVTDRSLAVVCPDLDAYAVRGVGDRLRRACTELRLGRGITVDVSIGFALSSGGDDLHDVLDFALVANQLDAA